MKKYIAIISNCTIFVEQSTMRNVIRCSTAIYIYVNFIFLFYGSAVLTSGSKEGSRTI